MASAGNLARVFVPRDESWDEDWMPNGNVSPRCAIFAVGQWCLWPISPISALSHVICHRSRRACRPCALGVFRICVGAGWPSWGNRRIVGLIMACANAAHWPAVRWPCTGTKGWPSATGVLRVRSIFSATDHRAKGALAPLDLLLNPLSFILKPCLNLKSYVKIFVSIPFCLKPSGAHCCPTCCKYGKAWFCGARFYPPWQNPNGERNAECETIGQALLWFAVGGSSFFWKYFYYLTSKIFSIYQVSIKWFWVFTIK